MAFRRLISQIDLLSGDGDVRGLRNDKGNTVGFPQEPEDDPAFVDEGMVEGVNSDGTYDVLYRGVRRRCFGTTDEPIRAGQVVYVSKTIDGDFIVHGSAG